MALPKFPITEAEIDRLVAVFYARVRVHPLLGPIFMDAVGPSDAAWREHEDRIASFWRNAIGLDRSFSGNPMLKHLANSDVQPELFPVWLELFRTTAAEVLPGEAAAGISALADRIGRSLSMGLVQFRQRESAPPKLGSLA
ncbi:Group 3 truncated hemoglobin ctb [Ruegeria sp. THAF57]|uniref:group III truncated hemoglobin n=1 Tax=Ruegeria sp. THAF57 TaxID=2744555 RepID=UPI0015DD5283|nr:group III truncated hemoglobin [Ruegeria sp. THAF57]CAD0187000.1 Group 3 truncated hemoglobin ctb [Ruegeria sp. THAF57]